MVSEIQYSKARFALIIIGTIALGLLAINQGLGFMYKVHFLKAPCDLCSELNPGVGQCITQLNKPGASYYGVNGWTDPHNQSSYNITIGEEWK